MASEEVKYVRTVKVPEIQQAPFTLVRFVVEVVKWLEKSKLKTKSRKFK